MLSSLIIVLQREIVERVLVINIFLGSARGQARKEGCISPATKYRLEQGENRARLLNIRSINQVFKLMSQTRIL